MSSGLHLPDFIRVWINGSEKTSYVTSYERTSSLCQRADTFTISFTKEMGQPDPYDSISIKELYEGDDAYVIKGYIVSINEDYQKSTYEVVGQDKSLLLDDYFIYYQINAYGGTVDYWISYLADIVGLDTHFDSYTTQQVGEADAPTPLGLQTIGSAMDQLERAGAYYIKYDGDLDALRVFRYEISRPTITLSNDETTSIVRTLSTDKTRNVAKVYGGWRYNMFTGVTSVAIGQARVSMPELIADKTTVLANPLIRRDSVCRLVARRILAITGNLDDVRTIDCHGFYPNVKVGEYARVNVSASSMEFDGDLQITSITTTLDKEGAVTSFKLGEKCPRVSIVPPAEVVFAAGSGFGALISLDAGNSFESFAEGLTGSSLNSWSIAANQYNQLMLLTYAGLYKRSSIDLGTSWSQVTIVGGFPPDPINTEGANPAPTAADITLDKVVDEPTRYGHFHLLANASGLFDASRAWVYTTKDFGATWTSTQLYTTSSSGVSWNAYGLDMVSSPTNNLFVLVNSIEQELTPEIVYLCTNPSAGKLDVRTWDGTTTSGYIWNSWTYANTYNYHKMWSLPADRNVIYLANLSAPDNLTGAVYTYVDRSIDGGYSWTRVHGPTEFMSDHTNNKVKYSYGVWFDESSSYSQVRLAFAGWHAPGTYGTCHARFVSSAPEGSTSYTDADDTINYNRASTVNVKQHNYTWHFNRGAQTFNRFSSNVAFSELCARNYTTTGDPPVINATYDHIGIAKLDLTSQTVSISTDVERLSEKLSAGTNDWFRLIGVADSSTVTAYLYCAGTTNFVEHLLSINENTITVLDSWPDYTFFGTGETMGIAGNAAAWEGMFYDNSYPSTKRKIIYNNGDIVATSGGPIPLYMPILSPELSPRSYYTYGTPSGVGLLETLIKSTNYTSWTAVWSKEILGTVTDLAFKDFVGED